MNTAILSSTIGGSAILIASVIGALMYHILAVQRNNQAKIESGFEQVNASIHNLDTKFTGQISDLEVRLTDKFTGQISDLEVRLTDKFTGHLTDLRKEVYDGFKDHGERLARIEVVLKIDPPSAEAA
ncbi:MAG: hypothetical protein KTV68_11025 [Acidimicrobiia bacterium]|nr:hypothetical protein [Acidimicrobiia bacterium]